ncbi:MAG: cob(I)yrinic acid a,c-diamide adenosyltransferase [Patescibacteria group bacterium]
MIYHKIPDNKKYDSKKELGYIHVYTGEGKGKTTAALGMMLRALGHGHSVLMVQFLKGAKDLGEVKFHLENPDKFKITQFAHLEPINLKNPSTQDRYLAQEGLDYAREVMVHDRPDLLVLDEINPAMHYGLIDYREVIDFLDNKHQNTEVVLTGRYAHPEIIDIADLVTNMESKKHYFDDEFTPRYGIEH